MIYILLILGGVGAANALTDEYIFEWLRELIKRPKLLVKLFDCLTCMSFWTTLVLSLCFQQGWMSIPLALTASLIGKLILWLIYRE